MLNGIEETVAGGWCGECLGIESAADRPASIGIHLIAYVIDDFIPGQFAPDAFGIKKRYLAMFATSQLTAAVVLTASAVRGKTSWVGRMLMPSVSLTPVFDIRMGDSGPTNFRMGAS